MKKVRELLKRLSEKKISGETRLICSGYLKDMTDKQKEENAGRIIIMLDNSKDEEAFISEMKRQGIM